MSEETKHAPISNERLAEILSGLEGVTQGPWQVVVDEHPWALPAKEILGEELSAATGFHKERRIFTTWVHAQAKAACPVVNQSTGIAVESGKGIQFVSIQEADAAHIARCDPDTIRSLITELQECRALTHGAQ